MMRSYPLWLYCGHCWARTLQRCHAAASHRPEEAAQDWRECTQCGWWKWAAADVWTAPPIPANEEDSLAERS